jgi:hypothetical protein
MGKEYLHGDINTKVILYQVDKTKTNKDSVYSEVGKNEVVFLPPIELNASIRIEESKNTTYDNSLRRNEPGNLVVSIYIQHLKELKVDINYGDYIGYMETEDRMRFYSVSNDGKVVPDNKHSMFGYKPFYRTITCVPAQESEFNGI